MFRNFKYRIRPNKPQIAALSDMLGDFCTLYNACLEQRISAYRRCRISLRYGNQAAELKAIRAEVSGFCRWSFTAEQQVMRRMDKTFSAFFKRGKGFPRFRARNRFDSADMRVGDGLSIRKSRRITVVGVPGEIKVVWHRALSGDLGHAVISRSCGKWYVCFQTELPDVNRRRNSMSAIGIDLGLNSLIATSNGETVAAPRFARKTHDAMRRKQRALARCERGSKRRLKAKARLSAVSAKVKRRRRDFTHQLSARLVAEHSHIAFEKLNLTGLKRGMLARSVHDAAWSQLVQFVTYKAACAGRVIALVDPRHTSQTCPDCGTIKPKKLSERMHRCECGCVLDRDVAAAKVVLQRAD